MKLTLSIDLDNLTVTDECLAAYWHAVQFSPAPFGDVESEEAAEKVGREIIRRWLASVPPALWNRQGRHISFAPVIADMEKTNKLLSVVDEVVAHDHGANIPSYRQKSCELIERLEKALAEARK